MKIRSTLFIIFIAFFGLSLNAQDKKCSAYDIHKAAIDKDPTLQKRIDASERAIAEFIQKQTVQKTVTAVITIPVVIHVIHNGEAVGTGTNLSDAQAIAQITRLNEDFRKRNADTLTASHAFYSLQADTEIEFCLASTDPQGNPTTGITRYDGGRPSWEEFDVDSLLKPATIWDRYEYLNIWSLEIDDPASPGLDGWGTFSTSTTDSTDGIVVKYDSFGDFGGYKSIVATHEVGHYLNLNHIWGDNQPNCGDDLVGDTPPAAESNELCPTFPHNPNSNCGTDANGEMFMNYMDYSDAICTVMFTPGQKARMIAELNTSRASLLASTKCNTPTGIVTEKTLDNKVSIYPNPSTGKFTVELSNLSSTNVSIKVYNYAGSVVTEYKDSQSTSYQIDLSELAAGIYFVNVTIDNKSVSKKIVISK